MWVQVPCVYIPCSASAVTVQNTDNSTARCPHFYALSTPALHKCNTVTHATLTHSRYGYIAVLCNLIEAYEMPGGWTWHTIPWWGCLGVSRVSLWAGVPPCLQGGGDEPYKGCPPPQGVQGFQGSFYPLTYYTYNMYEHCPVDPSYASVLCGMSINAI